MQITIADRPEMEQGWLNPEEQPVTFQIALVGSDGLVVGSDQKAVFGRTVDGKLQFPQQLHQKKYFTSDDGSVTCFAAGGHAAMNLAVKIVSLCDPVKLPSESRWTDLVRQLAASEMAPYSTPDELLVVRRDTATAFWLVSRRTAGDTNTIAGQKHVYQTVQKISEHVSTGASVAAKFLPQHLWKPNKSIAELKKLALLTMSYAAREEPSFVGPPFDIMTLDKGEIIEWSENDPINDKFQPGLERLFGDLSE